VNDNDSSKDYSVTDNGNAYELAGYRLEGGDWQDIENGAPLPEGNKWEHIDLVTVNLDPESEDGFYRSFDIFDGFDELYEIDDLVDEAADAYGFGAQ
jgi:hypothetical protein